MSTTYQNPVHRPYFADPFVWESQGVYYAHGTGPVSGVRGGGLPMARSEDLVRWENLGGALETASVEGLQTIWAGSVAAADGRFFLYYSAGIADRGHLLRVAIGDSPAGPFRDTGTPLTDSSDCPFAIDPQAVRDDSGNWYLIYCADFLDTQGGYRPGTGLVARKLRDMTRLDGEQITILRARYDWQRFQKDRPMYGGVYDWHTLEGAHVCRRDGLFHLFYSAGRWENESYCVDYAVSRSLLGPYSCEGGEEGPRILKTVPGEVIGPGNMSVIRGPDGVTDWAVYHAWDVGMTARRMCIDPLAWTPDGTRCAGPTWTRQQMG